MRYIFALRKKKTDSIRIVQAETFYRAVFTAGWNEEETELMGRHTIKGYLKNENIFDETYKKTAKTRKEQGL